MAVVRILGALVHVGTIIDAVATVARRTCARERALHVAAHADLRLTIILAEGTLVLIRADKTVPRIACCRARAVETTGGVCARRARIAWAVGALVDVVARDPVTCKARRARALETAVDVDA